MKMYKFLQKIKSKYHWNQLELEWFIKTGDQTAARLTDNNLVYRRDYGRGMLLYSLVKHFKPRKILEIGTGRGYSGICMVRALRELNLVDHYFCTVDPKDPNTKFDNVVFPGGTKLVSIKELYLKFLVNLEDIGFITGRSTTVIPDAIYPSRNTFDFVFVDGSHKKKDVIEDVLLVKKHVAKESSIIVYHDYKCIKTKEVAPALDFCIQEGYMKEYLLFEVATDGEFSEDCSQYVLNNRMGSLVAIPKQVLENA